MGTKNAYKYIKEVSISMDHLCESFKHNFSIKLSYFLNVWNNGCNLKHKQIINAVQITVWFMWKVPFISTNIEKIESKGFKELQFKLYIYHTILIDKISRY